MRKHISLTMRNCSHTECRSSTERLPKKRRRKRWGGWTHNDFLGQKKTVNYRFPQKQKHHQVPFCRIFRWKVLTFFHAFHAFLVGSMAGARNEDLAVESQHLQASRRGFLASSWMIQPSRLRHLNDVMFFFDKRCVFPIPFIRGMSGIQITGTQTKN